MRVLLDANVLVSFLLQHRGRPGTVVTVVSAAFLGAYALLLPAELLRELDRKLSAAPYLRARITVENASAFTAALAAVAETLPPLVAPPPSVSRDLNDDYLIAQALAGNADFLVSGDKDLLALATLDIPCRIVSPAEFLVVLEESGLI